MGSKSQQKGAAGGRIVEMAQGHTFCIEKKLGRNYRLRGVVTV